MVKSINKRIILGFVIVLILLLCPNVHAESITSISTSGLSQPVSNTSTSIQYDIGQGNWANWGSGYFYYSFSLVKTSQTSTDYVVFPSFATAYSGAHEFICEIGSVSVNNSTHNGQTYSAKCPMTAYGDGVVRLRIRLFDYGVHPNQPIYEIHINGLLSFEKASSSQVNVDMSSVTQQQQQTNEYLKNQIIDIQNNTRTIEKSNKKLEEINNHLTDESDPNTSGFLQDINQDYSNNPVSDLITMPITFLQTLNNNVSGSCITWDLGSLLGHNLKMPCINLEEKLGSNLYNLIDMAICLFLAYNLGLMCVTIWNNMTSLKDDFDDMYSPKHVYQPKHSGGES